MNKKAWLLLRCAALLLLGCYLLMLCFHIPVVPLQVLLLLFGLGDVVWALRLARPLLRGGR